MKLWLKKIHHVINTSTSFVSLFILLHYFFRNEPVPAYIIAFYIFFYGACFLAYRYQTFKIDGRFNLFLVFMSALLLSYFFKSLGIQFTTFDYIYYIGIIFLVSIIQSLIIDKNKVIQYGFSIGMILAFIVLFGYMIIQGLDNQWILVLVALFKLIPFIMAYSISQHQDADYRNVLYVIYFFPLILMNNLFASIFKSIDYISVKNKIKIEVINDKKEF